MSLRKRLLVPANRFEVLECEAARDAVLAGELDGERLKPGGLDVLAQHVLGTAAAGPFHEDRLYREVTSAAPYRDLARDDFDHVVDFVATGGYALKRYDRYARLRRTPEGLWRIAHPRMAQEYRLNVGVIVEEPMLDIRLLAKGRPTGGGGRLIGRVEEYFLETLAPGDTFVFGGEVLRFEGIRETAAYVTRTHDPQAQVPSYMGGKFPLSTFLAARVREMLADPKQWSATSRSGPRMAAHPEPALAHPRARARCWSKPFPAAPSTISSAIPSKAGSRTRRWACWSPAGSNACACARSASSPTNMRWRCGGLRPMGGLDMDRLFDADMLGDDLDAWLAESALYKRTFRNCAIVAGLIQKRAARQREDRPPGHLFLRPDL